jgi:hypothetical protein
MKLHRLSPRLIPRSNQCHPRPKKLSSRVRIGAGEGSAFVFPGAPPLVFRGGNGAPLQRRDLSVFRASSSRGLPLAEGSAVTPCEGRMRPTASSPAPVRPAPLRPAPLSFRTHCGARFLPAASLQWVRNPSLDRAPWKRCWKMSPTSAPSATKNSPALARRYRSNPFEPRADYGSVHVVSPG